MRTFLAILVPLLLASGAARAAPLDQLPACGAATAAPQQCVCAIEQLRPTQVSVGWLHVRDILEDPPAKLRSRAERKPTQVVVGPGGALYVTDGHHHARAMLEQLRQGTGESATRCQVVADYSNTGPPGHEAFLAWLAGRHQARLNGGDDVNGAVLPNLFPPDSLAGMTDDSYRSLASFVEDGCGFSASGDYGQFPLADLLRHARVPAPVELAGKKKQGVRAAAALVAATRDGPLRQEFDQLPNHDEIQVCATLTQ